MAINCNADYIVFAFSILDFVNCLRVGCVRISVAGMCMRVCVQENQLRACSTCSEYDAMAMAIHLYESHCCL